MQISEKHLQKNIKLYKKNNKEISNNEALKVVKSLVNLVEIIINDYIRREMKTK